MDPVGKDVVFPTDADLKLPIPDSPLKLYKKRSLATAPSSPRDAIRRFTPPQDYLRKERRPEIKGRQRTREAIKFDPLDPYAESDSDDEVLKRSVPPFVRSPTRSNSMTTLAEEPPAKGPREGVPKEVVPSSEDEEDVTTSRARRERGEKWTPDFIRRHSLVHKGSSATISQAGTGSSNTLTPIAFSPVPATPSLIKAVARVNAAQQDAHSQNVRTMEGLPQLSFTSTTPPINHHHGHGWDTFWHDVKTKAGHGFHRVDADMKQ